jgi:hypothetical protein
MDVISRPIAEDYVRGITVKHDREFILGVACALCMFFGSSAVASDTVDAQTTIRKWMHDFNACDMNSFLAGCAPSAAVIDGFPPYARTTCADWMNDYHANSKAIQLTDGRLWIGEPTHVEVTADHAYMIYPESFSGADNGKAEVYRGSWTMTFAETIRPMAITGSGSAWTGH